MALASVSVAQFAPDWQSLASYRCPDWFRDAKFGITTTRPVSLFSPKGSAKKNVRRCNG